MCRARRTFLTVFVLAALSFVVAPPPARAATQVDVGVFFDALAPYGVWSQNARFGWVWAPSEVGVAWRPYLNGHWVYVEPAGWTWVADEAWGWATDHYGRWFDDPDIGWVWIPGAEWAPAWVDWQLGDGVIGWAPLPPGPGWSLAMGFDLDFAALPVPPAEQFIFVAERDMTQTRLSAHLLPTTQNAVYLRTSRRTTSYVVENDVYVNQSVSLTSIEQQVRHPIERLRIADSAVPGPTQTGAGVLRVYRPKIDRTTLRSGEPQATFAPTLTEPQLRERQRAQQAELAAERRAAGSEAAARQGEQERRDLDARYEARNQRLAARHHLEIDALHASKKRHGGG